MACRGLLAGVASVAFAWGAVAQQEAPLSPLPDAPATHSYTTKPSPIAAPAAAPAAAPVANPFGKSTAAKDAEVHSGPPTTRAVPVENVDAIESSEPMPAEAPEVGADPVKEDPTQPTDLTAPIFSAESNAAARTTVLLVLNKVTARAEKIELKPDQPVVSGKLRITATHCQHSDANSLPDDAALITVAEISAIKQPDKPLFSGWMYQSSPSISGLEHPIYDVSLVVCKDPAATPAPLPEAKKAKKKAGK